MKSIEVKTSSQRAAELIANPEAYFASVRKEARLAAHGMPRPDPECEDPGIPEAGYRPLLWPRRLLGTLIIWSCRLLDCVPWHDGRWYLRGQRGCAWGVANLGFKIYGDDE